MPRIHHAAATGGVFEKRATTSQYRHCGQRLGDRRRDWAYRAIAAEVERCFTALSQ